MITVSGEMKKVVIIGGGITGLSAAFYLQKEIKDKNLPIETLLIEGSHRLGGKIQTVIKDGFIIERGPDSFLERKTSASKLAHEVGLGDKLVNNATGQSFVLVKEKLHPIPGGSIMGIPTKLSPFVTSGLFSPVGKLRAAADFVLPRSKDQGDQSLGQFFRRRLGREVVENLIEPLLSGIYAGDIDKLSLMSTFPQFYEVEKKYRSLIIGMGKSTPKKPFKAKATTKGQFLTLTTGLQSFVDTIEHHLDPNSIKKGTKVEHIKKHDGQYYIHINTGEVIVADSVIIASPHSTIPMMFPQYDYFESFHHVPSTSVATVAMAFDQKDLNIRENGTGFVVSRNSSYTITACTWTHKKWPHTTPKGKVLIRLYVGRAGDEEVVNLSDDVIVKMVLDDLKSIMNLQAKPEFTIVSRWKDAMPQYTVGHKDRLNLIRSKMEKELPGVILAGSSFDGLGIPDCIDQGIKATKDVLQHVMSRSKQ